MLCLKFRDEISLRRVECNTPKIVQFIFSKVMEIVLEVSVLTFNCGFMLNEIYTEKYRFRGANLVDFLWVWNFGKLPSRKL